MSNGHFVSQAILESIAVKQNITRTEKTKANMLVTFETSIMAAEQSANQTLTMAQGQVAYFLEALSLPTSFARVT